MTEDVGQDDFFGTWLVGIDEAGRGPLAGPVVAAGVMLDPEKPIDGLRDSKKLTEKARESLYEDIMADALFVSVKVIDVDVIDRINIFQATLLAMKEIIISIKPELTVDAVLIDGKHTVSGMNQVRQIAIVSGDNRIKCIMAASIIAKVERDRLMKKYDEEFPGYGFLHHKGYGTEAHLSAIAALGPCAIHRMSFSPFRE